MISLQKYRIVFRGLSVPGGVSRAAFAAVRGPPPPPPQRLQLHPLRPVLHDREVRLGLGVAELGDVDAVIGAGAVLLPGV